VISHDALVKQLKKLDFNPNGWGRTEVNELCNILMPDEEIEELVNGYYEAGFALMVATKHRVLLVDKKPLNYLTVEDMRFDMISEFDYSHRIIGAHVSISSSGNKSFSFTSLNQTRLRRLLNYVQTRMTEMKQTVHKQQETQQQHLEEMNEQLRQYLQKAEENTALVVQAVQTQQNPNSSPAAGPQMSPTHGYMLPEPTYVPTETLSTTDSFEKAAAVSMGLSQPQQSAPAAAPQPSVLRKVALTPQQIGLAAIRRVVPIVRAYSRPPTPPESQYATGVSTS
jgi:hypothetical protein